MLSYKQLYIAMVNGTIEIKDNEAYPFYPNENNKGKVNWIYGSELKAHQKCSERIRKEIAGILAEGTYRIGGKIM